MIAKRYLRVTTLILSGVVFTLLLTLLILFFFTFVSNNSKLYDGNDSENISKSFKTLRMKPLTNDIQFGKASLPFNADEEGMNYFYEDGDGYYHLIYEFGTREYQCTGSCSCDNNNERRSTTVVVKNGLFFLVGALTAAVAYERAKHHFQSECEMSFENAQCPSLSKITSTVDQCEQIVMKFAHTDYEQYVDVDDPDEEANEEDVDMEEEEIPEDDGSEFKIECEGRCMDVEREDMTQKAITDGWWAAKPSWGHLEEEEVAKIKVDLKDKIKRFYESSPSSGNCESFELKKVFDRTYFVESIGAPKPHLQTSISKWRQFYPIEKLGFKLEGVDDPEVGGGYHFFAQELEAYCAKKGRNNEELLGGNTLCEGYKGGMLGEGSRRFTFDRNPSVKCWRVEEEVDVSE